MKKLLFSLLAALTFFVGQKTANAQAAPTPREEAAALVASVLENKYDVDSLTSKYVALRDEATRQGKRDAAQYFEKVVKFLRELRGFGDRVVRAGEKMPETKLNGFKAEATRFDKKLEDLTASKPQSVGMTFGECLQKCNITWSKWWMVMNRLLCKLLCPFL